MRRTDSVGAGGAGGTEPESRGGKELGGGTAGGTPVATREASAGLNYQEALLMNRTAIFD
jgi:hypothetical protein